MKNTSLKSAYVGSVSSAIGRYSMPGVFMSMMSTLMPLCFGTSVLVRTKHRHQAACCAPDVHTFWPLTMNRSPSSTAFVVNDARSLPAFGSLMPRHQLISARSVGSTKRSRCSGVPKSMIDGVMIAKPCGLVVRRMPRRVISSK